MINKKIEETLNLPSIDEYEKDDVEVRDPAELAAEVTEIVKAISNTEKIDNALALVTGLDQHDLEMDDVASEALKSYKDLMDMGMSSSEAHAGRIFEAANSMLKVALEARDAKANRKLRVIDLQIKKARLDANTGESHDDTGQTFDRNQLIDLVNKTQNSKDDDDSDK